MAPDTNTVVVTGRLTRDAESRTLQSGVTVTDVRVASNSREKKNGEWADHTNFLDVTLWGRDGLLPYLVKGVQVTVTGRLRFEEWEKNGERRSTLRVVAQDVQLLNSRGENTQQGPPRSSGNDIPTPPPTRGSSAGDMDIPFRWAA